MRREIDGACTTIPSSHTHFPEFALKWGNMRHPNLMRAELFQEFGNMQKVGVHVGWKTLQLWFGLVCDI